MAIDHTTIVGTSNDAAGGTVTLTSTRPINGLVVGVRNDSAAWGGTADYNFYRAAEYGGGTVLSLTNQAGPFEAVVGGSVSGLGTGQAAYGVACPGYLKLDLIQATGPVAGTVHVYYTK